MTQSPTDDTKRSDEADSGGEAERAADDAAASTEAETADEIVEGATGNDQIDDAVDNADAAMDAEAEAATTEAEVTEPLVEEVEPASEPEPVREPEASSADLYGSDAEDSGSGKSFAGMALQALIIFLVVFGLSLWLVPMVAPHLPASIAKHVMPGQQLLDDRLANLDKEVRADTTATMDLVAEMRTEIAALSERLAAAEAAAEAARAEAEAARTAAEGAASTAATASVSESVVTAAEKAAADAATAAETATTAATSAGKVAAAATRDTASLARQMTDFEVRLSSVSEQIGALGSGLAATPSADGAPTQELSAAFAALKARVDGLNAQVSGDGPLLTQEDADRFATQDDLRSARTALTADVDAKFAKLPAADEITTSSVFDAYRSDMDERMGAISSRIDQAATDAGSAAAAAGSAEEAAQTALGKVEGAIRDASLRSAVAALTSRMRNGAPFAAALDEIESLTGATPPEALTALGATGVATTDDLLIRFSRLAKTVVAKDIEANAEGEGILGQANARLQSVIAGRPKSEQTGDDTGAILSRVEARLREGALPGALSEAETLSAAAQGALGPWLGDLKARVAGDAAADAFIAGLSADQG
ncbi:MAG: mitofilin family membrane protein [Pseudomonadota bacterium]